MSVFPRSIPPALFLLMFFLGSLSLTSFSLVPLPVDPPPAEKTKEKRKHHRKASRKTTQRLKKHLRQAKAKPGRLAWAIFFGVLLLASLVFAILGMIWFPFVGVIILFIITMVIDVVLFTLLFLLGLGKNAGVFRWIVLIFWGVLKLFGWGIALALPYLWIPGLVLLVAYVAIVVLLVFVLSKLVLFSE